MGVCIGIRTVCGRCTSGFDDGVYAGCLLVCGWIGLYPWFMVGIFVCQRLLLYGFCAHTDGHTQEQADALAADCRRFLLGGNDHQYGISTDGRWTFDRNSILQ